MHGFDLTRSAPPFGWMAMMQAPPALPGSFIMPIPPETTNGQYMASTAFTASQPGTYYYLCPVPGHAQRGMFGKLVIR